MEKPVIQREISWKRHLHYIYGILMNFKGVFIFVEIFECITLSLGINFFARSWEIFQTGVKSDGLLPTFLLTSCFCKISIRLQVLSPIFKDMAVDSALKVTRQKRPLRKVWLCAGGHTDKLSSSLGARRWVLTNLHFLLEFGSTLGGNYFSTFKYSFF
jgi:hypothetical protein